MAKKLKDICNSCLHAKHKGECRVVTPYGKKLQKVTGKKQGMCGCPG